MVEHFRHCALKLRTILKTCVSMSGGTNCATYEYGPFGEVIRATGPMAKANPFRFSTKYQDDETDLLYYGNRYYNASTGRWLSSDPIGEDGGLNVYGFVSNDGINSWDAIGFEKGAELLINPPPPVQAVVIPEVVVRRFIDAGGHQWLHFESPNGTADVGVNKGQPKGIWVDERANPNRSPDELNNPARYYEWQVIKRNLGWMKDRTPCKCASVAKIIECIAAKIIYEADQGTPRKFNIICNNCRYNSERVLQSCCAQKGKLTNNPDDSNFLTRFIRDWTQGPPRYISH